jgi:Asp-tRNA(Asn)/Glu-tRNA(Gln) amidotransferase A subunit family amidase
MSRALLAAILLVLPAFAQKNEPPFEVEEATIDEVHAAMKAGRLTCRALVDSYLLRIAYYDKNGPAVNAIILVNPDAGKQAAELDERYAKIL